MFMSQMPLSQSTIMGYMRDGKVHVATNIYNVQRAPAMMVRKKVNGKERGKKLTLFSLQNFVVGNNKYNDGKWHILRFLRRANSTWFSMDQEDGRDCKLNASRNVSVFYCICLYFFP